MEFHGDLWKPSMRTNSIKKIRIPLQVMVLGRETVLRSSYVETKKACFSKLKVWIANPLIPAKNFIQNKMYESFDECPIRTLYQ